MIPHSHVELSDVFRGARVLVTGHTGFKGSWLTLWLSELQASVTGVALPPDTTPALFADIGLRERCVHREGDIRDRERLARTLAEVRPDFIFHLAAQSLVRRSYRFPLSTLETNVQGTANLLDAVRETGLPCVVLVVTSDKCYENSASAGPFREEDPLGGHDPYSTSKAAAEVVTAGFRRSFFPPEAIAEHGVALATARAGNVIGGGDWASDRLVPDAMRALGHRRPVAVRHPDAVRPWQHVLEPLSGYLLLAARLSLHGPDRGRFCEAWNFGPKSESERSVRELVETLLRVWGEGGWEEAPEAGAPPEAGRLTLAIEKAESRLKWAPRWGFEEAVRRTVEWYRLRQDGASGPELLALMLEQIRDHAGVPGRPGRSAASEALR